MDSKQSKETWKRLGSVARILAGKLLVARELEKMAAAPVGESDGQGGLLVETAIGGEQAEGAAAGLREHLRATSNIGVASGGVPGNALQASGRKPSLQIGGIKDARAESRFVIVGTPPAPGRAIAAPLKLGWVSHA